MSASLAKLLLRQSEAGCPAILWGRRAMPHFGNAFDRLLAEGVLVEEAPATAWPLCDSCECGIDERPVQHLNGRIVAACPIDANSDTLLEADDLRSFRIDASALVRAIASASNLGTEPCEIILGVWHLGATPAGQAIFLTLSVSGALQPGLLANLRATARGAPIVLAVPDLPPPERQRIAEVGVHLVNLQDVIGTNGNAILALDLSRLAPADAFKPRLILRRSAKTVELDGVPLGFADQTFELLCLLAEKAPTDNPFASSRDVESRIWGSSIHRVSREARDVVRELRDALAAGASDSVGVRGLIENRRGRGWRLHLAAAEIDLQS